MTKRFQVFVSSTYVDLEDERREIIQALLELDAIPSGMELFPAANDDQWTLIKRVIDDCDYYLVIVAGRYGSIGPEGLSFTEMEYRYALEKGKPIIAFLHKSPEKISADRTEKNEPERQKLREFRTLCEGKLVRYWTSPADLGSVVSRSLIKLFRDYPAVGWVRADQILSEAAQGEILGLRKTIDELTEKLSDARTSAPPGTESLQQGEDKFKIIYKITLKPNNYLTHKYVNYRSTGEVTWNELFYEVSPLLIDESSETNLKQELDNLCVQRFYNTATRIFDGLAEKETHIL